jgi:predicted glutamine amidotransferase
MCELLALSSSVQTRLTFSLKNLASHSGGTGSSRDGWGAAFFDGKDVALFREPLTAYGSALVKFLETEGPHTSIAISHIRHATQGEVSLANTQPFVRELAGRTHAFAHNGNLLGIAGDELLATGHFRPVGTTDSEHAFCALLTRPSQSWRRTAIAPPLDERLQVVTQFAADLRRLGPANFLYSDGELLIAHGHRRTQAATRLVEPPGLWILTRSCATADEAIHGSGVSIAPGFQKVVLITSVPLTDEPWRALREGEVVAITKGQVLEL